VAIQKEIHENETGRIVLFPTRIALGKGKFREKNAGKADLHEAVIEDLRKYERDKEPDDYTRRMIINVIAFAFMVALTLAGIWLVEQMATLRKHQDCAMTGRRNCADLDIQIGRDVIP
jgi:hypothetical protein